MRHHDDLGKNRGFIGRWREKAIGWIRLILSDSNSRNLLGFLLLNLTFAFVELFYGVWTNSLGLISDSFHMFFDCTGLMAGLVATVITKWKSNDKYTYGYVRAETLAGFINGLFLLFISFFIFSEAVERLVEPPEVKHERLLLFLFWDFLSTWWAFLCSSMGVLWGVMDILMEEMDMVIVMMEGMVIAMVARKMENAVRLCKECSFTSLLTPLEVLVSSSVQSSCSSLAG